MTRITPVALIFLAWSELGAQQEPGLALADSVTVIPAEYCEAGPIFQALAGPGYRELWTMPIRVPVADLDRLGGGGLTPMRLGGGMTTQTLHLRGADGRRYVFRSVRKATRQALAEEYWGTPVEAVVRDQLCSFHPSGAVVVAPLLDAVGVLHPRPQLLVVPDDPRLEEFREQFAGMFVLFEERPDDLPDGEAGFAGSRNIEGTEDFFDELEESPGEHLGDQDFLRSRLVDLLVGDRDRSINNHLWAQLDGEDGGHVWRVIPRDRDQAFVRFDGILKALGRRYEPRFVAFGEEYGSIPGLTRNAWDLDRNLLVGIPRESWDRAVEEVASAITDQVIETAVRRMPPEHYRAVGPEMEAKLKHRRDRLAEAAEELYEIVFREADIHGTDEDEVAVLRRLDAGGVEVSLFRRGRGSSPEGQPHFQRTFSPDPTREIRLYMHGGDDLVVVEGPLGSGITLRVVGGGGADELSDDGNGPKVFFYDDGDETVVRSTGARWIRRDAARPYSWWAEGETLPDFGDETLPRVSLSYDSDRGLVASVGIQRDRYGFLREPYAHRLQASVGYAFSHSEPLLEYRHRFRRALGPVDLELHGRYSGFEVVRFYGIGNETPISGPESYYQVHQKQLVLAPSLGVGDGELWSVTVGPVVKRTQSDTTNPTTYVTESMAYGTGTFQQAGFQAAFDLDGRDLGNFPTRGYHVWGGGSFYPEVLDVEHTFAEVHGEAAVYITPSSSNPTLAFRVGGKRIWGTYPYSDAAFLGGKDNLRGLEEQRFAGDGMVYGSTELRVALGRFVLVVPTDFGVLGLADLGRVFVDGESSDEWHTSTGGGVWFAPVTRSATLFLAAARGQEHWELTGGMGFGF